jgi:hypothetical protein
MKIVIMSSVAAVTRTLTSVVVQREHPVYSMVSTIIDRHVVFMMMISKNTSRRVVRVILLSLRAKNAKNRKMELNALFLRIYMKEYSHQSGCPSLSDYLIPNLTIS